MGKKETYEEEKEDKISVEVTKKEREHERRKTVLNARALDLVVEEDLNALPDGVGPGAENVAAGHVVVVDHLGD